MHGFLSYLGKGISVLALLSYEVFKHMMMRKDIKIIYFFVSLRINCDII